MYFEDIPVLGWPFIPAGIWTRETREHPGKTRADEGGNKHQTALEGNQGTHWCESAVLTAVPLRPVSVRFYFCVSADALMTPAERPKAVAMERCRSTWGHHLLWRAPAENIILVKKHKMKREEPTVCSSWAIACLLRHNFIIHGKLDV